MYGHDEKVCLEQNISIGSPPSWTPQMHNLDARKRKIYCDPMYL